MATIRQVLPSTTDIQVWARATRSLPHAFGSDPRIGDPISLDGHLWLYVPLSEEQLRGIWLGAIPDPHHPESGWHRIDEFKTFRLDVAACKRKEGLFPRYSWLVIFGFEFGGGLQEKDSIAIQGVGRVVLASIPDLFDLVEAITNGQRVIPTRANSG